MKKPFQRSCVGVHGKKIEHVQIIIAPESSVEKIQPAQNVWQGLETSDAG